MENLNLNAQIRSTEEKLSEVRESKMIPAVVYGKKQESLVVKINYWEFLKLFRISGESHIISLDIEWKKVEVLVHDVQRDPVKGDFLHIDFIAVVKGQKVNTKIHLSFEGSSSAVKEGAIIEEHIKELEVKVLPKDLVDSIKIDLSKLKNIGDSIRVSDIEIDTKKFEVLNNSDDIVVSAAKPAKIEVEAPVAAEETTTEEK